MLYRLGHFIFRIIYRIFFRRQVHGYEYLPQQGPLIICSNHINWQDPLSIGSALPVRYNIKFMAKEELFRNRAAAFILKQVGAFPVDRQKADYRAIRLSFKILEAGGVIGLFPEGTRSKSGNLQRLQEGAALIAARSGAPVLPVLITGPYRLGGPLNIHIGPVFHIPGFDYDRRDQRKTQLREGSRIIQDKLEALYSEKRNTLKQTGSL